MAAPCFLPQRLQMRLDVTIRCPVRRLRRYVVSCRLWIPGMCPVCQSCLCCMYLPCAQSRKNLILMLMLMYISDGCDIATLRPTNSPPPRICYEFIDYLSSQATNNVASDSPAPLSCCSGASVGWDGDITAVARSDYLGDDWGHDGGRGGYVDQLWWDIEINGGATEGSLCTLEGSESGLG